MGIFVEGRLLAVGDIHSLSKELFTAGMYLIEIGIDDNSLSENGLSREHWLRELLAPIEGVEKIVPQKDFFEIQCTKDLSVPIAKRIVESGAGLSFLNRHEYGLDAIYNRYFEGGKSYD